MAWLTWLLLLGASTAAVKPSTRVTDLVAQKSTVSPQLHVTLSWTVPRGSTRLQIRYAHSGPLLESDWAKATVVSDVPAPAAAGTVQTFTVVGLKPNTSYWWAIKASAGSSPWGPISNSAQGATSKYEGYGSRAVGGGEKPIYRVTTLADSGAGSLREAVAVGSRYVVFDVGGTIALASRLDLRGASHGLLTIDGSTAPAPGITIAQAVPLDDGIRIGDVDNVILTHLRLRGSFDFTTVATEVDDTMSTNSTSASAFVSNMVWDHLTVRNAGDSAMDLWDRVQDFTMSYCLVMENFHPMTTGGDTPSARQTVHHNVWANNGERHPQLLGRHTDFEYVNNVVYHWGYSPHPEVRNAKGAYALRIRNNSPGPKDVDANIVNNYFVSDGRSDQALVYGRAKGPDPGEEGGPRVCRKQGEVFTESRMGDLWVAGNVFPQRNCDEYSTLSSPRPTPEAARVTIDPVGRLMTSVLPSVGTQFRQPDERELIDEVETALRP